MGFCDDHLSLHPDTRERHGTCWFQSGPGAIQCNIEPVPMLFGSNEPARKVKPRSLHSNQTISLIFLRCAFNCTCKPATSICKRSHSPQQCPSFVLFPPRTQTFPGKPQGVRSDHGINMMPPLLGSWWQPVTQTVQLRSKGNYLAGKKCTSPPFSHPLSEM